MPTPSKSTLHNLPLAHRPQNKFNEQNLRNIGYLRLPSNKYHIVLIAMRIHKRRFAMVFVANLLVAMVLLFAFDYNAYSPEKTSLRPLPEYENVSSPYCRLVRHRIDTSIEQWVRRSGDPELRALFRPLFTQRRLVIWSADFHISAIADLKVRHADLSECRFLV